ncbi:MAG: metallophosphoesterase [Butyrivibrio sp.]|nr:metallophosphoesterase [Butyrivibrio sp.]
MKVLVIPDIHLKPWIFDRAAEILREGKAEGAVCLMDIPDDWGMELSVDQYRDTFDRAISFAEAYPETLWCYGNHDVSYPWGKLETGYSPYAEATVISKLDELKDSLQNKSQIAFIHRIDNVLFMHGGLTAEYVSSLNPELLNMDIDDVLKAANSASDKYLWDDGSPLWLRPQYKDVDAFRRESYTQVVGHTPVKNIYEKNSFISTDVFSTYSDGRQIGESAMIIIDTETRNYEKIPVMGKLGYKIWTETVDEEKK